MKKYIAPILFLVYLFIGLQYNYGQVATDVFISEYIEGTGNNKAIELYNGTSTSIDLVAGNYVVQVFFNGSATAGLTVALQGTIVPNSTFVLAHSAASFSGVAQQVVAGNWFNGDDVIILKKGGAAGTILDAIGQVGVDPGTQWGTDLISTADNTLRKKASICKGDSIADDLFDPFMHWEGFPVDDFTGLGTHTATCYATSAFLTGAPDSLIFNTNSGIPSPVKTYLLHAGNISEGIFITSPAAFQISLNIEGTYTNSISIPSANVHDTTITIFTRFNPIRAVLEEGKVIIKSGNVSSSFYVKGFSTGTSATRIFEIQGTGATSPLIGTVLNTEGLVTASFQHPGQLNGFYIQDTAGDGNNLTSDGIFVFNTTYDVKAGDYIKLTGKVEEFAGLTEIKSVSALTVLNTPRTNIIPTTIKLPVSSILEYEKYEGMLVRFPQTLTATEVYGLGRYGEVLLSSDGRLVNPTNYIDPNDSNAANNTSSGNSNVAAITSAQDLNNRRSILLDDGSTIQNPLVIPYLSPTDTTLRVGTTVNNLPGVLDFSFNTYRIQPVAAPQFNYASRPLVPTIGKSNLKIASFNVLNYFNGNGDGGGFPTPRGANTQEEFSRQRAKTIAAITKLNGDIVGLIEMENDGDGPASALVDLVTGLNAYGKDKYAYIMDPKGSNGNSGTDAIKVAIIYKPASVTPVGNAKSDTSTINNRPPLAQTFISNNTREKFTFIVNHFKSKGCEGATGPDVDQNDGQSCFNDRRKLQAVALLNFISRLQYLSGDPDIISVGDYNSYGQEDPLDILRARGLVSRLDNEYSFVFQGQSGSLDHVFLSKTVEKKISGVAKWHINADEPVFKDYNKEFNPPYAYSAGPYRSSDHDPVLVGLNLSLRENNVAILKFNTFRKGYYTFYFNADDKNQLWLAEEGKRSTKLKLATLKSFTEGQGNCYVSDSILLDSGSYSVISKGIRKNGIGLAWKTPSGEVEELLPSKSLYDCINVSGLLRIQASDIFEEISDITISPVPVQEVIDIRLINKQPVDVQISIVNTLAVKQLNVTKLLNAGYNNFSVAVDQLPPGIYVLTVETRLNTYTKKIIIEK